MTRISITSFPPRVERAASFVPLLADTNRFWKWAAFSQNLRPVNDRFMGRSIRTDRWRYTEWAIAASENAGVELYDETADPKENVNVAGEDANQAAIAELKKQLKNGWKAAMPKP